MRSPEKIKKTCIKCNTLKVFIQKIVKKGAPSSLTQIERRKARRGHRGNLGKFSKTPTKGLRKSKRPHVLLTCSSCGHRFNRSKLARTSKYLIHK